MATTGFVLRALMVVLVFLSGILATGAAADAFTKMVVFGDSLSDTGRLFELTHGAEPPIEAYGGPEFPGRYSNGPLWPEYLAPKLGVTVENFAVAGAHTSRANEFDGVIFPGAETSDFPGLLDQIAEFVEAHPTGANRNALYVIWAGSNDFLAVPLPDTIPGAVANIVRAVRALTKLGARHVAVASLPDLGLTPQGRASDMGPYLSALSAGFNITLETALEANRLDVVWIDVFALTNRVVANPGKFDFEEVAIPCLDLETLDACDEPQTYAFWDPIHPTTRGHEVIAGAFAKAINAATGRNQKR